MKILILLILISTSTFASSKLHEGECVQEETVASEMSEFLAQLKKSYSKQPVSKQFCSKVKECFGNLNKELVVACEPELSDKVFRTKSLCGLTRQEFYGLSHYMESLFSCLNKALYSGNGKKLSLLTETVNSALKKFPKYEGFVFRGSYLPTKVVEKHKVGSIIEYKAFTSSSTNQMTGEVFSEGGQMFLIYSLTGRPVMGLSSGENEVLFRSGTKFKILKSHSSSHFIMREVSPGETKSKAKAEDDRVLALALEASTNEQDKYSEKADVWHCPLDPHNIPEVLKQKIVPNTKDFFPKETK